MHVYWLERKKETNKQRKVGRKEERKFSRFQISVSVRARVLVKKKERNKQTNKKRKKGRKEERKLSRFQISVRARVLVKKKERKKQTNKQEKKEGRKRESFQDFKFRCRFVHVYWLKRNERNKQRKVGRKEERKLSRCQISHLKSLITETFQPHA